MATLPTNAIHVFWSERMVGMKCEKTHRLIDSFSSIKGKQHRQWFHDPLSASVVALNAEGAKCIPAALNHIYIDSLYSDPATKIIMEMTRLAETAEHTPPKTRYDRCRVKR